MVDSLKNEKEGHLKTQLDKKDEINISDEKKQIINKESASLNKQNTIQEAPKKVPKNTDIEAEFNSMMGTTENTKQPSNLSKPISVSK